MTLWLAAFWLALIPPVAALGDSVGSPWLFNAAVCLGSAVGSLVWVRLLGLRMKLTMLLPHFALCPFLVLCLARFQHALFVWSAQYANFALATVLFRLWPVAMVGSIMWLTKTRISMSAGAMSAGALVCAAAVVVSQHDSAVQQTQDEGIAALIIGVTLGVGAAVLSGFGPAAALAIGWRKHTDPGDVQSAALIWFAVACCAMAFPSIGTSVVTSEHMTWAIFATGLTAGALNGSAAAFIVKGNTRLAKLGRNAALIASPVLALIILRFMGTSLINLHMAAPFAIGAITLAVLVTRQESQLEESGYNQPPRLENTPH